MCAPSHNITYACLRVCVFACLCVCVFACLRVCIFACIRVCVFMFFLHDIVVLPAPMHMEDFVDFCAFVFGVLLFHDSILCVSTRVCTYVMCVFVLLGV